MEQQDKQGRSGRTIALLLVMVGLGLGGYVIWHTETAPRTDDAYVYADTINVAPEVSGRIVQLSVRDNQHVMKGDVLFRLDTRPFQATLDKAEANLNALNHEIELTQRSVNAQKLAADAASASVERARAALEQSADTLDRMTPLQSKQYISAEQIDQARTAKRSAQAAFNTAQLEAQRASAAVSGVDALVAKREIIKAEIALARLNLEYATVRAPFDGVIIDLKTSIGQFAAAGHPIFTMANSARWYVVANFRETELGNIKPGEKVESYVLSDPSRRFSGKVESIGYGVFPDDGGSDAAGLPHVPRSINWVRVAQRFPVKIAINQPDAALFRIGESAVAILKP